MIMYNLMFDLLRSCRCKVRKIMLLMIVLYRYAAKFTHVVVPIVLESLFQLLKTLGDEQDDEYLQFDV